jgi:hypothetical protein
VSQIDLVREIAKNFCINYLRNPYLCYTEHGIHALFFNLLYSAMPEDGRYALWRGQKVCIVQKEYPTFGCLDKPQRQHWDISVLQNPLVSKYKEKMPPYDCLCLDAIVEFGLNETEGHLKDDIQRLSHTDANVKQGFIIHLYRLSTPGDYFSKRDLSPKSTRILSKERVADLSKSSSLEVFYGLADSTQTLPSEACLIKGGEIQML